MNGVAALQAAEEHRVHRPRAALRLPWVRQDHCRRGLKGRHSVWRCPFYEKLRFVKALVLNTVSFGVRRCATGAAGAGRARRGRHRRSGLTARLGDPARPRRVAGRSVSAQRLKSVCVGLVNSQVCRREVRRTRRVSLLWRVWLGGPSCPMMM